MFQRHFIAFRGIPERFQGIQRGFRRLPMKFLGTLDVFQGFSGDIEDIYLEMLLNPKKRFTSPGTPQKSLRTP